MKKLMYPFLLVLISAVLAACGADDKSKSADKKEEPKTAETDQQDQQKQMEEMQKKMDKQKLDEEKTVAIVNDQEVLGREYNSVLTSSQMMYQQMGQDPTTKDAAEKIKKQTLDSLVGQTLLLQEADKKGYKASDEEVKKQLEETKGQFKNDKEFETAMKQAGLNPDSLEKEIANNIKYTKYIEGEIKPENVTDADIQKFYEEYASQGGAEGQEPPKLEEVKPQIKQQLEQQKQQEMLVKHVEDLKKNAKIDIKV
ncbi:MAG: SurA N-terminal domain-containing protein [Bacillota bacterium]|jgi:SurA N-terminal domain|uniref:SurA N-terminal domain-containing protein n=1 Tax=Bacillaceae TaxID=186817 RepID=UPI0013D3BBBB|nr:MULTISPECIES: SurA N-terminal domain-containing protein [Bacillaceae]MBG9443364.1 peptidylprolyl isomerase [Cytobacillus firmus]MCC3645365.1 SurA N-terminal domain-containing protein [Cytobacillus oceanisediminis]MCS0651928.1 SurA N-terminal domain-containing protein [Cytobacillus firmus]MCU1804865.1 SurA N-terminal domain-containing protein [Cytobacillus firmus]